MKQIVLAALAALLPATAALAQGEIIYGTIEYGTIPAEGYTQTVPLAPGETVIGVYAAPAIVQMPPADEIVYETYEAPPAVEIDRVTGLPRNEAGWTGDDAEPAGIGCFPQGVCAHLN